MEADFSGYATKAGLKCSDGRTIMGDAFKHQDKAKVPLVWQHGHSDPENVLGHVILESREDGVWANGFFNDTAKAEHARTLVEHKDINMMSIWANDLIERSKIVLHGAIREVSLVLSGANPGALIENVTIRHSDDDDTVLEDEAIIYTGLTLEHSDKGDEEKKADDVQLEEDKEDDEIKHADNEDDETIQDVYDSMSEKQKQVLHYMIGQAIESSGESDEVKQDNLTQDHVDDDTNDLKEGTEMKHNVFENDKDEEKDLGYSLTHSDMEGILADATRTGSLKESAESFALAHGITDIDYLFPEAATLDRVPEWDKRRTEWVAKVLGVARKSPFSRIKTISANLTEDEARAKGYITGTLKKEEFFSVSRRITTPTTIYKKQKLDRDDLIDITDFDVVAWLKGEMRLMLDEEIARAILVGDGRDVSDEDKINEGNIRPIASDHELYTTSIYVNMLDASSSIQEMVDALILNRHKYKGTGLPTMFTTETVIAKFLLLKDTLGRRIYKNLEEVATELRVSEVVPVEVMEDDPTVVAVLVNMNDYVVGATGGGQVSMFDDFDIDYNQYKYLIETRMCGALTKLKSAMVVRQTASAAALVVPAAPTFNPATGALTIVNTTGVVYKHGATTVNAAGSPYTVATGTTWVIDATPSSSSYYFATSDDDQWSFTAD